MSLPTMRNALLFFGLAGALTAATQTPVVLAIRAGETPGGALVPLMLIAVCGPTIAAIAMTVLERRRVRELFMRPGARPTLPLVVVALAHVAVAHLVAVAALAALGRAPEHLLYLPTRPEHVAILVLAPLGEEFGWRGYALPRLQAAMSPLAASAVIAVAWTLWHAPTFFLPGASPFDAVLFLPLFGAGSVIYTWLYNTSRGSMLVVVLAHVAIHADNVSRGRSMGDGDAPMIATTAVLCVAAAALVATGRLRREAAVTT